MKLPDGYEERSAGRARAFVWSPAAEWMESVLREGITLTAWAAGRERVKPLVGRGTVYAVDAPAPGPDGRPRWAVRRYHRGGLVAPLLGDRYLRLGASRPLWELVTTVEARARGIPAPAVVAGAMYRSGVFYRADLVTELVPNARTLDALIFQSGGTPDAAPVLLQAGRLVRALENARVLHTDLNAANILLVRGDEGSGARVVDLDRCRVLEEASGRVGHVMRRRLERSLRKLSIRYGRPIADAEWQALRAGYEGEA